MLRKEVWYVSWTNDGHQNYKLDLPNVTHFDCSVWASSSFPHIYLEIGFVKYTLENSSCRKLMFSRKFVSWDSTLLITRILHICQKCEYVLNVKAVAGFDEGLMLICAGSDVSGLPCQHWIFSTLQLKYISTFENADFSLDPCHGVCTQMIFCIKNQLDFVFRRNCIESWTNSPNVFQFFGLFYNDNMHASQLRHPTVLLREDIQTKKKTFKFGHCLKGGEPCPNLLHRYFQLVIREAVP